MTTKCIEKLFCPDFKCKRYIKTEYDKIFNIQWELSPPRQSLRSLTQSYFTRLTTACHGTPSLATLSPCLRMTHFNIILLPIPKSSKLFSAGSPTKALPAFLISPGILNWVVASISEFKLLSVTSQMQFCYWWRSQTLQLYNDSEGVITYVRTVTSSSISMIMHCFWRLIDLLTFSWWFDFWF